MVDQWSQATKKLFELTESGTLRWEKMEAFTPPETFSTPERVRGLVYSAKTNGKTLVVYEEMYPHGPDGELPNEESRVVIEFVDDKWRTEWRWPGTDYRWQLLDAIQFQVAAGSGFLESLLAS